MAGCRSPRSPLWQSPETRPCRSFPRPPLASPPYLRSFPAPTPPPSSLGSEVIVTKQASSVSTQVSRSCRHQQQGALQQLFPRGLVVVAYGPIIPIFFCRAWSKCCRQHCRLTYFRRYLERSGGVLKMENYHMKRVVLNMSLNMSWSSPSCMFVLYGGKTSELR